MKLEATNAWRTLARKKWRKIEPYDNEIPLETPVLFRQVIDGLIEQGELHKSEILSTTKLSRNDVEDILSLPSRYLENDFGKIINFKDKGLKKPS